MSEMIPFNPDNVSQAMALAEQLAGSTLLPQHLRGKPADVLVVVMTGRELGLSPMQAIRSMYVVSGKAALSADMMVGLVVSRKDVCVYMRPVESTDKIATYETQRVGSPEPVRMSFTIEQARRASLLRNATWTSYPEAMLRARAAAALCRAVYPDLLAGVYEQGEAQEIQARDVTPKEKPPRPAIVVQEVPKKTLPEKRDEVAEPEMTEEQEALFSSLLHACIDGFNAKPHKDAWGRKHADEIKTLPKAAQDNIRDAFKAAKIKSEEPPAPGADGGYELDEDGHLK